MRGTPYTRVSVSGNVGIIPAYAGNTGKQSDILYLCRDHPRVCGEHLRKACFRGGLTGSSPRMRGTH